MKCCGIRGVESAEEVVCEGERKQRKKRAQSEKTDWKHVSTHSTFDFRTFVRHCGRAVKAADCYFFAETMPETMQKLVNSTCKEVDGEINRF